jgi:hypothetical protein
MSVTITMPALGESVTEGLVTCWLRATRSSRTSPARGLHQVDTEIPAPASVVLPLTGLWPAWPPGGLLRLLHPSRPRLLLRHPRLLLRHLLSRRATRTHT